MSALVAALALSFAVPLAATLVLPLLMLLGCLRAGVRDRMVTWLVLAPVPGLWAALFAVNQSLDLPPLLLRLRLSLDLPGAILLGVAALLWMAAGIYAAGWLRDDPRRGRIAVWWLLTLTGSLGVFVAADLVSFYLLYSLVSLAAYGLVIEAATADAQRVGLIYVAFAVVGEALLLIAFVMLAQSAPGDAGMIHAVVAALPGSRYRVVVPALLILGFGIKLGMVPFQAWMPVTYRTAPIPAAAVMSGAAVKAGVIGLIRFLPLGAALPGWGQAMVVLGFVSAFYGALVGLRQSNPRTVLAFSSISQMGVIVAVFGMGLMTGSTAVALAAAFYGAHHTLAKGGLFLGVGLAPLSGARRGWLVLVPAAIMALGMAGLPLTGGYLAKLAIKPVLGYGLAGVLGVLSSAATALLMTHFLCRVAALPLVAGVPEPPRVLAWPWLATALASVLLPWVLFAAVPGEDVVDALSPLNLIEAALPVAVGVVLGLGWRRWGGFLLRDQAIVLPVSSTVARSTLSVGAAIERVDAAARLWPVATASLLALVLALAALMWG
ncbi:complex I subunit 5 family protein [Rhodopila sp.]|jgi:formate hydrogenlyase subunit 3/multisubunit Na+/H+ antiporter MnhD subunit|uniref:complex I subunit 5 family protein n=1 Tax=Rhodopila sp. TaxID=2480087 RepID=UPI002C94969A|nr:complex I subunit 5 family protein [Rhodopila sp.]HVZ08598.1 complex I subunit 5 family protein [Rhodopila sp.]